MNPIDFLGHTVKDEITDFTGIATAVLFFSTGTVQIQVQPRGTGNNFPDAVCVDQETIVLLPEEKSYPVTDVPNPTNYLNKKVEEKVTGLRGVATKRTVFMNGCEYYHVRHEELTDGGEIIASFMPAQDLTVMEPEKVEDEPKTRTGGPSMKADRY